MATVLNCDGIFTDPGGTSIILDGLLCSILKALSRKCKQSELVDLVAKSVPEDEVKSSWKKLFSYYYEAMDIVRKKKIIDIER